jgi:hypothetical protein
LKCSEALDAIPAGTSFSQPGTKTDECTTNGDMSGVEEIERVLDHAHRRDHP